ncbi:MAG: amino acid racemase [Sphingobium sp.]
MTDQSLTIGILGGMGPHATVAFLDKIVHLTPAAKDWDHLHVVVDNHPKIPSRTRHILYDEPSPVPGMIDACRRLETYPVDFIALPCNSACYFLDQIAPHLSVPVLNIMEETVRAVSASGGRIERCLALGGRVTWAKRTYEPFLRAAGITYVHHDEAEQQQVEALIEAIKLDAGNAVNNARAREVILAMAAVHGADCIILGCTEFGCLEGEEFPFPVFDSSHELARSVVAKALKGAS